MEFCEYASAVKAELQKLVKGDVIIDYDAMNDIYRIFVHFLRLNVKCEYCIHRYYREGLYPSTTADVLKECIIDDVVKHFILKEDNEND